jgi:hypothetical protein
VTALRAALAARIEEPARAKLAAAEDAARRGAEVERAAAAEVDRFADVDERIASARASRIANWAVSAGGELPPELFDIDDDLIEARRLRDEAAGRLAGAKAAAAILAKSAAEAETARDHAAARVDDAAAAILAAEADALADRLDALKAET